MAWNVGVPSSTEGKMLRTVNGNSLFYNGAFYVLGSPATAYTNSAAETSLFVGEAPVYLGSPPQTVYPGSTRVLPSGALTAGSMFGFDFYAQFANTAAPTLRLRLGLVNSAGTFVPIADTTAIATTTETGTVWSHLIGGFSVTSIGTAGSTTGYVGIEYGPAALFIVSPLAVTSIDTTQQYSLDIRATWGAASASNSLRLAYGAIKLIG